MGVFAVIEGDKVVNVVLCEDDEYASEQGWVDVTDTEPRPGPGWNVVDGEYIQPEPINVPVVATVMEES